MLNLSHYDDNLMQFIYKKEDFFLGSVVLIIVIKYTHLLVSTEFEAKQFCPVVRMVATESRGKHLL